jgi:plastocyanin
MRRIASVSSLAAILAFALGACASGKATGLPAGPTTAPAGKGCSSGIDMTDSLKFDPQECTVKVGDTVTWTNTGSVPHTVTAEDLKTFDSGDPSKAIGGGGTFKFTFAKAGSFPYFCRLHASRGSRAGMIGTITVEAA